jgi:hypothetical protein
VDREGGISSLYLVSDSRFSDAHTGNPITDEGQKIYACQTAPHLFGYCGWVNFAAAVLEKMVAHVDAGVFFDPGDNIGLKQEKVASFLRKDLDRVLPDDISKLDLSFTILHAARERTGLTSQFRLWLNKWSSKAGWVTEERELPRKHSELVYQDGSGAKALLIEHGKWQESDVAETSRAVFGAFCTALIAGTDCYSGGAPQLGGLFRDFGAQYFGVVYRDRLFFKGKRVAPWAIPGAREWFNERFEGCDPTTRERGSNRQPQPSPWSSKSKGRFLP